MSQGLVGTRPCQNRTHGSNICHPESGKVTHILSNGESDSQARSPLPPQIEPSPGRQEVQPPAGQGCLGPGSAFRPTDVAVLAIFELSVGLDPTLP